MALLSFRSKHPFNGIVEETMTHAFEKLAENRAVRQNAGTLTNLLVVLAERLPEDTPWRTNIANLLPKVETTSFSDPEGRAVELFDEFRLHDLGQETFDEERLGRVVLVLGLIMKSCPKQSPWFARAELLARENLIKVCQGSYEPARIKFLFFVINLFPKTETARLARVALDRSGSAALGV